MRQQDDSVTIELTMTVGSWYELLVAIHQSMEDEEIDLEVMTEIVSHIVYGLASQHVDTDQLMNELQMRIG